VTVVTVIIVVILRFYINGNPVKDLENDVILLVSHVWAEVVVQIPCLVVDASFKHFSFFVCPKCKEEDTC
jgi:hypothetical protein